MKKMEKKLIVDKKGYEQLEENIRACKRRVRDLAEEKKEAAMDSLNGRQDSFIYEDVKRRYDRALVDLAIAERALSNAIVVEKSEDNSEVIDINDYILVELSYNGEVNEEVIYLTGSEYNMDSDFIEVTLNSPLGKAIYGKKVGEETSYEVNDYSYQVKILSKLTKKEACEKKGIKVLSKD